MKKFGQKAIVIALTLVFALSMAPFPYGEAWAQAQPDSTDNSDFIEQMASQLQDRSKDPFGFRSSGAASRRASDAGQMPTKFDLRNVDTDSDGEPDANYVTPIKFQNPFGTCWGFGAIAAAESSILGNDELNANYSTSLKQGEDGKEVLDLSEKHLVNFAGRPIADKNESQYGEGRYYKDESLSLEDKFNFGGLPIYATSLFSSGMGPILENRDLTSEGYAPDILEYHGKNGDRQVNKLDGKWVDFCYSKDDDWSIPEELRFRQSYVLKESYMLPSPAKIIEVDEKGNQLEEPVYEYVQAGTDAIKEQLLNKRAVEIGFHADHAQPDQEKDGVYISRNWAHYTNTLEPANHAVTIVGYDDDYDKSNFVKGKEPPENGAWLVKNSWGSGEEEFPNHGDGGWGIPVPLTDGEGNPVLDDNGEPKMVGSGYFWLSYYDKTLSLPEALEFDRSNVNDSYYLDQYDFMPVDDVLTAEMDDEIRMANVFKAEATERLEQISCQTSAPGTKVNYHIYILTDNFKTPEDGICVSEGETEPFVYGGFHKIELEQQPVIQKGQNYAIVLEMITEEGQHSFNMIVDMGEELAKMMGQSSWIKGVVNKNESFMYLKDKWADYTDEKFLKEFFGEAWMIFTYDNFPIKGYCREIPDSAVMYPNTGTDVDLELVGDKRNASISIRFKGKAANVPEDAEITWNASEESLKVFDYTVREGDSSRVTVEAKKAGTGYIFASCDGVGTIAIRVNVSKEGKYNTSDYSVQYGDTVQFDATDHEGKEVDLSTVTLRSGNTKVFTISPSGLIKAVGIGKANGTISDEIGAETSFEVEVYKADNLIDMKGKTATVKTSKLKKKAQRLAVSKTIKYTEKGKGKKTYKLVSAKKGSKSYKKFFKIDRKTGKLTIKKNSKMKKGTYKVKVKVRASGNAYYRKSELTAVTFKIKVK